ncbi:MAG: deoxyribodipyrimidine photo-lyase [Chitinophagia bacterium]|nr:deoxyribodipyrimidine photo-lyase [Chitinophagia bacterium]
MQKPSVALFWFRRDLRLTDNAGLYHALKSHAQVVPIFIFDKGILSGLDNAKDRRVHFIHWAIDRLQTQLTAMGSTLHVLHATVAQAFEQLLAHYHVEAVYTNHDYEPYALNRDKFVADWLATQGIPLRTFKDQVIFEKSEVVKDDGSPYTVYTPYSKKWKQKLTPFYLSSYPIAKYAHNFYKQPAIALPTLRQMGFEVTDSVFTPPSIPHQVVQNYDKTRDIPGIAGTTRMSIHLRFGTISIRELYRQTHAQNEKYANELIWRDFYMMILHHFPKVAGKAFKPEYETVRWLNHQADFERWCAGTTGYPIVDAGMRELNATGYMHNRVRMITASFLTKHLLIDWRWGEAYFAQQLLDFDLAANNGGWQWAAGSGCDAAPYFRIFNPYIQTHKFDPQAQYINQWVPEWNTPAYPPPIVDHEYARTRCLEAYKTALSPQ